MSMATECKFFGHIIPVEKALAIRDSHTPAQRRTLAFECPKCGRPVRPHIAGDRCGAHFVHINRNPDCPIAEPVREY
ncbi:hypothetical protein [Geobacter sp. SVR]|uniref:hypothetical protein n=1 Tax=Geobacter sp. SVR TaxID=2495594 RepID=UPI00143EFBCC|nr:hypothetical protein [Geobacter sp. SVR]BCS54175.1 hypothetical protein GSVR_24830 [Geobacter sp. SVR]GCF85966.1 hypothetical protein GSbR_25660 [Geobacter sp. SVR]